MFVVHVVWETMTTISDDGELALGIADISNDGGFKQDECLLFSRELIDQIRELHINETANAPRGKISNRVKDKNCQTGNATR